MNWDSVLGADSVKTVGWIYTEIGGVWLSLDVCDKLLRPLGSFYMAIGRVNNVVVKSGLC